VAILALRRAPFGESGLGQNFNQPQQKQGIKAMSLIDILNQTVLNAPKFTRAQIAANNYARLTGKRAPDNLSESWADK
jgi:hypothetical protein